MIDKMTAELKVRGLDDNTGYLNHLTFKQYSKVQYLRLSVCVQ